MARRPDDGALRFYGVVDAETTGAGDRLPDGVVLVTFRDLGAAVVSAPYERVRVDDGVLEEYTRVVDLLYQRGPILPAPPGTVFRNAAVLRHWLEIHYAKLHEALGIIERRDGAVPPYDLVRMELGA